MSKLLIVIPAYNEEANIVKVVNGIVKNYPQYDYVVCLLYTSDAADD